VIRVMNVFDYSNPDSDFSETGFGFGETCRMTSRRHRCTQITLFTAKRPFVLFAN